MNIISREEAILDIKEIAEVLTFYSQTLKLHQTVNVQIDDYKNLCFILEKGLKSMALRLDEDLMHL